MAISHGRKSVEGIDVPKIGDRVRVKSKEDILALCESPRNRFVKYSLKGKTQELMFVPSMEEFCGKVYTVYMVDKETGMFKIMKPELQATGEGFWWWFPNMVEFAK